MGPASEKAVQLFGDIAKEARLKKIITALLIHNSHTLISLLKMHNSLVFRIFTALCNRHHSSFENITRSSPQKETRCPLLWREPPPHPFRPKQARTSLLSMELSVLDVSYKWNPVTCGSLCLASCAWHDVFRDRAY